jgi:molybdopterin-guanine dinucleotide biosynthesis protein B
VIRADVKDHIDQARTDSRVPVHEFRIGRARRYHPASVTETGHAMFVFGIVGRKNAGKTHLVTRLLREGVRRGLTISTVKHAHHAFDVDVPGKDSWLHREAGAQQVLVASGLRWALMRELRGAPEPTLEALLHVLDPCDLVLVEGFKREVALRLEVYRESCGQSALSLEDDGIVAVATDTPSSFSAKPGFVVLPLDDDAVVLDHILSRR